jgi:hypothetical protein
LARSPIRTAFFAQLSGDKAAGFRAALKCPNALFLDGGSASNLYAPTLNRVLHSGGRASALDHLDERMAQRAPS